MIHKLLLFSLINFLVTSAKSEVIYNSNKALQDSKEARELLNDIKKIPKFSSELDPSRDISSAINCNKQILSQSESSLGNEGGLAEGLNGCLGYQMMEELVNKSSEASLTRKDYQDKLGLNLLDSLIKFVKNNEFEKAYNYLQIYYDKDVLYKTDLSGNSVFHILAQKCTDPKAQDFLMLLVMPPEYYHSKFFTPLKIKTTEDEQNKINIKCKKLSLDQVSKKFQAGDFFSLTNNKGGNVFDVMGPECKGTTVYDAISPSFDKHLEEYITKKDFTVETLQKLFPDSYKDKIAQIMLNLPAEKAKVFLKNYDFKDFNFTKEFSESLTNSSDEQHFENRKYIIEKFTLNSIQKAQAGTLDDSTVALLVKNGNFTQKDGSGESLLDSVRKNDNSVRYMKQLQEALNIPVLSAINNSKIDDPSLIEFMKNGDPQAGVGISIPFFTYVSYNKDEEFKKKIYDFYKVSIDSDDSFLNQLNDQLGKTKENVDVKELKLLVHDLCLVVAQINSQVSCDKFEMIMINNIQKFGMNVGFVTPVLNLIDQASLYGQNTIAYFLNSIINRVNPEIANIIASKRNFAVNIDPVIFNKIVPFVFDKIIKGEIEYHPERYKLREFIGNSFKDSIVEKYPVHGLGNIKPAPLNSAVLFGMSEKGEPVYIRDDKSSSNSSLVLKSVNLKDKIIEYFKCTDLSSCSTTIYKTADLALGGESSAILKGIKQVTSDDDFRSLITSSNLSSCRATCGGLLLSDLSLGTTAEVTSLVSVEGVATAVVKVREISAGLVRAVNIYEAIGGFLIESQEDFIRANDCETNCIVQDTFKKVEAKEKLISSRREATKFLDSKIENMGALQNSLNSIRSLAAKYNSDPRMIAILASFEGDKAMFLSIFKQYALKFNDSSRMITNAKDQKVIEREKMNIALAESTLVKALTALGNDYSKRINDLSRSINREGREPIGDPTGAGGHGHMPGRPSNPNEPADPSIPVNPSIPSIPSTPSNPSSGGTISIPIWSPRLM